MEPAGVPPEQYRREIAVARGRNLERPRPCSSAGPLLIDQPRAVPGASAPLGGQERPGGL